MRYTTLRSPDFRYDVMLGLSQECVAFRVTLAEFESIVQKMDARILWECAHRVGLTTVEVPIANRHAPCTFLDVY
jgi:hypothetical protein